eukprot:293351-Chlamydomonas_euryale.AAC.1
MRAPEAGVPLGKVVCVLILGVVQVCVAVALHRNKLLLRHAPRHTARSGLARWRNGHRRPRGRCSSRSVGR